MCALPELCCVQCLYTFLTVRAQVHCTGSSTWSPGPLQPSPLSGTTSLIESDSRIIAATPPPVLVLGPEPAPYTDTIQYTVQSRSSPLVSDALRPENITTHREM